MPSLEEIVKVTITPQAPNVAAKGFGIPLILGATSHFEDSLTAAYASTGEMLADGWSASDPEYICAQQIFRQSPTVEEVIVGVRQSPMTMKFTITPLMSGSSDHNLELEGVRVGVSGGSGAPAISASLMHALLPDDWSATPPAHYSVGITVTNAGKVYECTALATGTYANGSAPTHSSGAMPSGGSPTWTYRHDVLPITASASGDSLFITANSPGRYLTLFADPGSFDITCNTAETDTEHVVNPAVASDLADILEENADWYAIVPITQTKEELLAMAAWAESNGRIMVASTLDSPTVTQAASSDSTSAAKALQNVNARRSVLFYHPFQSEFIHGAVAGQMLAREPGSSSWKFKTLSGVTALPFPDGKLANIRSKNCNYFTKYAGVAITTEGVTSQGEYADVAVGEDFLKARIAERVYGRLAGASKLPYTDAGATIVQAAVMSVLNEAVGTGLLASEPAPTCTIPHVADVDPSIRATRKLPNVQFRAQLSGAIHATVIEGTVAP